MSSVLDPDQIRVALEGLQGWANLENSIERVLQFPDFATAMVFVNQIAAVAEAANHHPDILINYNKVTLKLVSHDSGGVTHRDIRMAGEINKIVG